VLRALWVWAPPFLYMLLIFSISGIPDLQGPPQISDKAWHFAEYGGLAALALRALARGRWAGVTLRTAAGSVLWAAAYGAFDEWRQSFVPGRSADPADLGADILGAALAAGALWACSIIRARIT
jgi:VanZ family protein